MNQNQIKVIQSRLKNRGQKFTLAAIKNYVLINYHDEELTPDQISEIVEKLLGSNIVPSGESELSHDQQQTLIQEVASELDIDLSVDQVKKISQKMDWALSDRATLRQKICDAIVAWVDYKFDQDNASTDQMMDQVAQHFVNRLKNNNQHFNSRVNSFSGEVDKAIEKFRTTEEEILDLFKIPS